MRSCAVGVVGLGLAIAGTAHAGPGDHVRFGASTFTPSVQVGFDFQTNPYRSEDGSVAGIALQVSPNLRLQTDAPDVRFDLSASYHLEKYFKQPLINLDKYSDFDIDTKVVLYPDRLLSLKLGDRLTLQSRNVERPTASVAYDNQLRNYFTGSVPIHAGAALVIEPGGLWGYDEYYVADFGSTGLRPFNNRNVYGPTLDAEWSFFPMTAVLLQGNVTWNRWRENWLPTNSENSELGDYFGLPDSQSWEVRTGLRGRITAKLVFVGTIGYGQAYADEQSVIDAGGTADGLDVDIKGGRGIVGAVQFAWQFGPGQEVRVGYQRDFTESWFTNWLSYDEVFAGTRMRIGGRLGLDAQVKLRLEDYQGAVTRKDVLIRAQAGEAYYLTDWVSIDAHVSWDQRLSESDGVSFGDFGAFAGATFSY